MNPDEIAAEEEKKRTDANTAQSTSLTPEQGGTQLSGTAAPTAVTPTASTSAPTKTGATAQANIGGFQQANQAKIAALGNVTNQRLQERVGAANQAIAGQKAARVEDVNAQTYAGPKTASLEELGANQGLQNTLAGAGRKSDITNASQQVAGFGAYNELKNLANNSGSKAYANNLGLGGGSTDNLLSRSNAATQQGVRNQVRGVQDTLRSEQTEALSGIKAAGENVNKANEASVNEISTNLTGQATAAEQEGQSQLQNYINSRESAAVANANTARESQIKTEAANAGQRIKQAQDQGLAKLAQLGVDPAQYPGFERMINEGDIAARIQNLQKTASYNSNDMLDPNYKTPKQREAAANEVAKLQEQVQVYKEMQGQKNSARQAINTAYANNNTKITSFDDAMKGRSLTPGEYDRIQQGQQGLRQAKAQVADKGTGLSSLSAEKQAGYEALSRILKDPSKLSTIKKGVGSYSDFQKLLDNVR
jgi:hypothetical protein